MNRRSFLARASSPTPGATAASALPAPVPLSTSAGLESYPAPLDRPHAAHLLRRTGFGVSPDRLKAFLGQPATAMVAHPHEIANGPAYLRDLTRLFLAGVPWYEWDLHRSNAPRHVRTYLLALTLLPEYQLT